MMIFRSFLLQLTSKPVTVSYHYGNRLMVLIIRTLLRECVKFLPFVVSATLYVCRLTRRRRRALLHVCAGRTEGCAVDRRVAEHIFFACRRLHHHPGSLPAWGFQQDLQRCQGRGQS